MEDDTSRRTMPDIIQNYAARPPKTSLSLFVQTAEPHLELGRAEVSGIISA
jgi:hypothetical protein